MSLTCIRKRDQFGTNEDTVKSGIYFPIYIYRYVLRCYTVWTLRIRTGGSVREGNIPCYSIQRAQQVPPPFGGLSKIRNSYISSWKKKKNEYQIMKIQYIILQIVHAAPSIHLCYYYSIYLVTQFFIYFILEKILKLSHKNVLKLVIYELSFSVDSLMG